MFPRRRGQPDKTQRNRAGLDFTQADADEQTPAAYGQTDFVNVENMRHELFSQEFPEGPYGAPLDVYGAHGGQAVPTESRSAKATGAEGEGEGESLTEGGQDGAQDGENPDEDPFDPRMLFFFDGA
ncbi:MAG: hypothetical protein IRZ18_05700 [Clostridia bacterium]|nr:hypothetical protein [Clostridia bacterium]